jgi:hypothetical protein
VFKISRLIYYLDHPKYQEEYFVDAWVAFAKRKPVLFTHGFLEINTIFEVLIYVFHEALNLSDPPAGLSQKKVKKCKPSSRQGTLVGEKGIKRPPLKRSQAK